MISSRTDIDARQADARSEEATDQSADLTTPTVELPAITAPKGGGAIRSIDEKFDVNPATGAGSLSVGLGLSPGRNGFGPALSLGYSTGQGNGPFGIGWSLGLPSVARKTSRGVPKYFDTASSSSDTFILAGAEDLIPDERFDVRTRTTAEDAFRITVFRPRIEGSFQLIERWHSTNSGETHWKVLSSDNTVHIFGQSQDERIADPTDATRVYAWLLSESRDDSGNIIRYVYKPENSDGVSRALINESDRMDHPQWVNRYLKRILYGNDRPGVGSGWKFECVLDYGEHDANNPQPLSEGSWSVRADPFSSYTSGFEIRTWRLCRRVLMFHRFGELNSVGASDTVPVDGRIAPTLVRATEFSYDEGTRITKLIGVQQVGYSTDPTDTTRRAKRTPPVEFAYSQAQEELHLREAQPGVLEHFPAAFAGSRVQFVDIEGEGIAGEFVSDATGWRFRRGRGRYDFSDAITQFAPEELHSRTRPPSLPPERRNLTFAPLETLANRPSLTAGGPQHFADLEGDGTLDVVQLDGARSGFFERTDERGWSSFRPLPSNPTMDLTSPNIRMLDLTGDGLPDIMLTENDALAWNRSLGAQGFSGSQIVSGFSDEASGPVAVFGDQSETIFLADMSGDGLVDIVRIRNGDIVYWPSLGHGNFGRKVTMDRPPWFDHGEAFDPARIRLADFDGTGPTDLLYLARDGVWGWLNEAGNSWSDARHFHQFDAISSLEDFQVADLTGSGGACLVWSSPLASDRERALRYIDLMGDTKPNLIVSVRNNLGGETHVKYAPSTRFYLEDVARGRGWRTKLPFPVYVVERTEVRDWIADTRFVSTFSYHDGYFDGHDREFRNFGFVERWDTDTFADFEQDSLLPAGPANLDQAFHAPPVYTKTWLHSGAFQDHAEISAHYANEYYDDGQGTGGLTDTVLPAGLNPRDLREALRALKGTTLRQEVYALDGSPQQDIPYALTEQNFDVRILQSAGSERDGVACVTPRETLSIAYDRNPEDPRVSHTMVLATDDFCNVTDAISIAYPRKPSAALGGEDRIPEQSDLIVTYQHSRFINATEDSNYRFVGVPFEAQSFEVNGIDWNWSGGAWLQRADFDALLVSPEQFRLHHQRDAFDPGAIDKRLLAWSRTYFRDDAGADDLDEADSRLHRMPLGEIDRLGLAYETLTAVASSDWLNAQLPEARSEAQFAEAGYRREPDQPELLWAPSGRVAFDPQQFYLPVRSRDPFGAVATISYDQHSLMPVRMVDPLGNTTEAIYDYRVLQPKLVIDPNGARTAAAFDALGMLVGTALLGLEGAGEGDTLEGFQPDLDEQVIVDYSADPLNLSGQTGTHDPHTLLAGSSSRIIYDLERFRRTGEPTFAATLTRETHVSDLVEGEQTAIRQSMAYSNGLGSVILAVAEAEQPHNAAPDAPPRWVHSGLTVLNNKGEPVKQFEPYFWHTHAYDPQAAGNPTILHYDPIGRPIRTDLPDGTLVRTEFSPWSQQVWDANDAVLESRWFAERETPDPSGSADARAAFESERHADTPARQVSDTLGRPVLAVADNGLHGLIPTRTRLDIAGNALAVIDARGNTVQSADYDMLGRPVRTDLMDAGVRTGFMDIAGAPLIAWDARGHMFRTRYDVLRRPTHKFVRLPDGEDILYERIVYGESFDDVTARTQRLRGKAVLVFDGAGGAATDSFDFKGNPLRAERQIATNYRDVVRWNMLENLEDPEAILAAAQPALEPQSQGLFTATTSYDALNRVRRSTAPDGSEFQPFYNEAGLLDRLLVRLSGEDEARPFVANIDYTAKGQRERIRYGNGVTTEYEYNPDNNRLTNLTTTRSSDAVELQNLSYVYDAAGNIVEIADAAQQSVFNANQELAARKLYSYDAIYQLRQASGREHGGQQRGMVDSRDPIGIAPPHANDAQAMRAYTQTYEYDAVGNILSMRHSANGGSWTRDYEYATDSNQLRATHPRGDPVAEPYVHQYPHDEHGNMTAMPHLSFMRWSFLDQLQASSRQVADNGGTPETTYYVYGADGARMRKVTERQAGPGTAATRKAERIYVGGFEVYREYEADGETIVLERESLHVIDDASRIALVETRTAGDDGSPRRLQRYHLANHLGSTSYEVDETGAAISYEEFHPFGSTAYKSGRSAIEVSLKRHRFTGMERDEETDLQLHGARYYATWLGRWTAADPIGIGGGQNLYQYSNNRPQSLVDYLGLAPVETIEFETGSTVTPQPESDSPQGLLPLPRTGRGGVEPGGMPIAEYRSGQASDDEDFFAGEGQPGILERSHPHARGPIENLKFNAAKRQRQADAFARIDDKVKASMNKGAKWTFIASLPTLTMIGISLVPATLQYARLGYGWLQFGASETTQFYIAAEAEASSAISYGLNHPSILVKFGAFNAFVGFASLGFKSSRGEKKHA